MFIKMNCLFVIGIVVVLNCQVDAEVPEKVIIQLHHVVQLLSNWTIQNQNLYNEAFINGINQLGYQVSRILSLTPPEDVDFCLWQLNMMANQIGVYYKIRFNELVAGGTMAHSINEQISNFLHMIEFKLNVKKTGFIKNVKKIIAKHNSNESFFGKVIPRELNNLERYIGETMESSASTSSGHATSGNINFFNPSNLYLNETVSWKSSLGLTSNSIRVRWHSGQSIMQDLEIKYNAAVYESCESNGSYTQLMHFRYSVLVQTVLVSMVGHLDVHFTAYRLYAQRTGETGNDIVWDSVVGVMRVFIRFFRQIYGDSVVSEVYRKVREAKDLKNPQTLVTVCIEVSELFQSLLENNCSEMSSTPSDPRTTEVMLMDQVEGLSPDDVNTRLMLIVERNYRRLNNYINKLHERFNNVDCRKFEYFLNIFKQID